MDVENIVSRIIYIFMMVLAEGQSSTQSLIPFLDLPELLCKHLQLACQVRGLIPLLTAVTHSGARKWMKYGGRLRNGCSPAERAKYGILPRAGSALMSCMLQKFRHPVSRLLHGEPW